MSSRRQKRKQKKQEKQETFSEKIMNPSENYDIDQEEIDKKVSEVTEQKELENIIKSPDEKPPEKIEEKNSDESPKNTLTEKKEEEKKEDEKIIEEKKEDEKIEDEKKSEEEKEEDKKSEEKIIEEKIIEEKKSEEKKLEEKKLKEKKLKEKKEDEKDSRLLSIKLTSCKEHGRDYLKINPENFEVVCQKCLNENKECQLEILNRPSFIEDDDDEFKCSEHPNIKVSFYCDQCKKFVCKMCFAETHREHKCHLPKVIKKEFIEYVNESLNSAKNLGPILNDSITEIKNISDGLKTQKEETMKIPENSNKLISNDNQNQIENLLKKASDNFLGIDNEVNEDCITFNNIKNKTKNYLESLKEICSELNERYDNKKSEVCEYHHDVYKNLTEIIEHITFSNNFLNVRLKETENKFNDNENKINNSLSLLKKEILNYENSSISSITTGNSNKTYLLRRFVRFIHSDVKYFKTTLVGFAANDNIFLNGLLLCGLYIRHKKKEGLSDEELNKLKNESVPVQISILTMTNQSEGETLFSQKFEINSVINYDDPCFIMNFDKGVKIAKEKLYLIKVENLSSNNYIDIWTGNSGKILKKGLQVIRCHNTGTQVLFKEAQGIQTDFDEFDFGIIEGVVYSISK